MITGESSARTPAEATEPDSLSGQPTLDEACPPADNPEGCREASSSADLARDLQLQQRDARYHVSTRPGRPECPQPPGGDDLGEPCGG